jgi:predicted nucleic acid-binding protein
VQVLNEIASVACRKMRLSWGQIHAFLTAVQGLLAVQPATIDTHRTVLEIAERYGLSIHDATIVAAALHAHCETLWSERTCRTEC